MPKKKKMKSETIETQTLYRLAEIEGFEERADGEEKEASRTIRLAFSSEEPVDRFFGTEILDHKRGSIDLDFIKSGRGPLLVDHNPSDQVGVIEKVSIGNDRKGRAVVRFGKSARAEEILQDVKDGIRLNVSVGYAVNRMVLDEANAEGNDTFRVVDWTPLEISVVSIPADTSVGVGRNSDKSFNTIIERSYEMPKENENNGAEETRGGGNDNQGAANAAANQQAPTHSKVDTAAVTAEARDKETSRIRQITALGSQWNATEDAEKHIAEGGSVGEFRAFILENKAGETKPLQGDRAPELGMDEKDTKKYSFVRAINAITNPNDRHAQEAAAFEREVSTEAAKVSGITPQGILVPNDILREKRGMEQRDLNVGTAAQGGNLVGTDL